MHAGVGFLERLPVGLGVALPVVETIAFKPNGEFALLLFAIPRFVKVGIIPAIAAEYVLQSRGPQNEPHLIARHAFAKLGDLLGGNPVALLNPGSVRKAPVGRATGG